MLARQMPCVGTVFKNNTFGTAAAITYQMMLKTVFFSKKEDRLTH